MELQLYSWYTKVHAHQLTNFKVSLLGHIWSAAKLILPGHDGHHKMLEYHQKYYQSLHQSTPELRNVQVAMATETACLATETACLTGNQVQGVTVELQLHSLPLPPGHVWHHPIFNNYQNTGKVCTEALQEFQMCRWAWLQKRRA